MNFFLAHHGMKDAIKIVDGVAHLEANLDHAGPVPLFEKPRHGALNQVWPVSARILQKFGN